VSDSNPREGLAGRPLDPEFLRFLSQLAHELRTPLTGIKGSIGVVLANEPSGTTDPLRRMFQTIDTAADRMEHMIGNLSELVRMHSGKLELYRAECDLEALVRQVVDQAAAEGQLRGRPVTIEAPRSAVVATVDQARTDRAIRNLVAAAAKLLGIAGTVRIALASDPAAVEVLVAAELPGATDAQEPPPPLDLAACEDRISLELAVVTAIVERHGGHLAVESTPSGGMAFRVRLPVDGVDGAATDGAGSGSEARAVGA
jgi:two-component system sensor histidine kinase KdpD